LPGQFSGSAFDVVDAIIAKTLLADASFKIHEIDVGVKRKQAVSASIPSSLSRYRC
jgi:hypothetical protein